MVMIKFDCQEILDIVRTMDRPEPPAIFEVKTVKTMEEYDEAIIQSTVYRIACSGMINVMLYTILITNQNDKKTPKSLN